VSQDPQSKRGGDGLAYIGFIADELKPLIDRNYRTLTDRNSTVIGGSSLGGLISVHACIHRPDIFGGCAAMSPSLGWADEQLLTDVSTGARVPTETQIWLSMGTREGRDVSGQLAALERCRRLNSLLTTASQNPDRNIRFLEAKDGTHDERAWSGQLPDVLRFLFPPVTPENPE
jgi:predicted alpha/beta superfamily hydrolase